MIKKNKPRFVANIFSLSTVEFTNYVFPLLTLPYLVRILGADKYGFVVFVQAFVQYFVLLTDYGFNLTATRSIAVNRDNPILLSKVFSTVICTKAMLMLLSLFVFSFVVALVPSLRKDALFCLYAFGIVLGNILFPVWFFQGMESMKFVAVLNLGAKAIFTAMVFAFVKSSDHYLLVPLFTSAGYILVGVVSFIVVLNKFKVRFVIPQFTDLVTQLRDGKPLFLSTVATNFYTTTNVFLLGLLTNNVSVGYFVAGEKLVRSALRIFNPLYQSIYPHIAQVVASSKKLALEELRKVFLLTLLISLPLFVVFFVFSNQIVYIVLGSHFDRSAVVLRILSPLLVVIPLAHIAANLTLVPFRKDEALFKIYAVGPLVNIVILCLFVLSLQLKEAGAAYANLLTEVFLTTLMVHYIKRNILQEL